MLDPRLHHLGFACARLLFLGGHAFHLELQALASIFDRGALVGIGYCQDLLLESRQLVDVVGRLPSAWACVCVRVDCSMAKRSCRISPVNSRSDPTLVSLVWASFSLGLLCTSKSML